MAKEHQLSIRVKLSERSMLDYAASMLSLTKGEFIEKAAVSLLERLEKGQPLKEYLLPEDYDPQEEESKMMTVEISPEVKARVDQILPRLKHTRTSFLVWAAALASVKLLKG
jgi:uncharacterized protein (DUF1778 family)